MKARYVIVAVLYVLVGIPLMFVVWSRAAQLLNARSDVSVLLGCVLIFAHLIFMSLSAYLVVMRCGGRQDTDECFNKNQRSLKERVPVEKPFPETVNSAEYEKGKSNV